MPARQRRSHLVDSTTTSPPIPYKPYSAQPEHTRYTTPFPRNLYVPITSKVDFCGDLFEKNESVADEKTGMSGPVRRSTRLKNLTSKNLARDPIPDRRGGRLRLLGGAGRGGGGRVYKAPAVKKEEDGDAYSGYSDDEFGYESSRSAGGGSVQTGDVDGEGSVEEEYDEDDDDRSGSEATLVTPLGRIPTGGRTSTSPAHSRESESGAPWLLIYILTTLLLLSLLALQYLGRIPSITINMLDQPGATPTPKGVYTWRQRLGLEPHYYLSPIREIQPLSICGFTSTDINFLAHETGNWAAVLGLPVKESDIWSSEEGKALINKRREEILTFWRLDKVKETGLEEWQHGIVLGKVREMLKLAEDWNERAIRRRELDEFEEEKQRKYRENHFAFLSDEDERLVGLEERLDSL
ncbi:hypothetical protein EJ08DRAFT_483547 [Tothia fuscella]|uniref:Uncharacterized protein n=1 Tax=Tothia fuscella TaxID=1048955 RepID=A0A9P4NHP2_9PEZI|nr:hypothetical protein EJ08DRAFT_483547 [Tothia fuscella]